MKALLRNTPRQLSTTIFEKVVEKGEEFYKETLQYSDGKKTVRWFSPDNLLVPFKVILEWKD